MKPPQPAPLLLLAMTALLPLLAAGAQPTLAQAAPCPTNIDGQGVVRSIRGLDRVEIMLIAGGDRQSITVSLAGVDLIPPAARESPRLEEELRNMVELAPVYVDLRPGGDEDAPEAILLVPLNLTHVLNVNAWLLEKAGVKTLGGCKILELQSISQPASPGDETPLSQHGEEADRGRSFTSFAVTLLVIFLVLVLIVVLVSLYG